MSDARQENGQHQRPWEAIDPDALRTIGEAVNQLSYGSVVVTVHAAKIVQIEVTYKTRFGT